jgi:hypothetical protein
VGIPVHPAREDKSQRVSARDMDHVPLKEERIMHVVYFKILSTVTRNLRTAVPQTKFKSEPYRT